VVFGSFYTVGGVLKEGLPHGGRRAPPEERPCGMSIRPAPPRMGLLSFLKRQPEAGQATPGPRRRHDVERAAPARAGADRRGRPVGVGIIGFPLVFETQPRPIPVDLPIEIRASDSRAAPRHARAAPLGAGARPGHCRGAGSAAPCGERCAGSGAAGRAAAAARQCAAAAA
jgi:DedD protein